MNTSFLISQKIDENTNFVFLKKSKRFLIVENFYLDLFSHYNKLTKSKFKNYLSEKFLDLNSDSIYNELYELFQYSDSLSDLAQNNYVIPNKLKKFKFKMANDYFTINYDDSQIVKSVIGQLFHLKNNSSKESKNYYVFKNNDNFFLNDDYQNLGSWKKDDLHYLTGKLLSFFICEFHKLPEKKWSGFLHASAISKDNRAFLVIGESGDGKSTCSAILCKHGYNLMVDDISPINREGKVGNFPNSISIKNPSMEKINDLYSHKKINFAINTKKGKVRYLNPAGLGKFTPNTLSCFDIIKIKYDEKKENSIKQVKLKDILPIIINESYFPSSVKSVKSLMNWFINCKYYNINYNNDRMLVNFFEKIRNKSHTRLGNQK